MNAAMNKDELSNTIGCNYAIDLHMHSVHSDGTKNTAQLLDEFIRLQLDIVSITDHDNVDSYFDLEKLPKQDSMLIIPGVELSFCYNGELRDMLGYGIDIHFIKHFLDETYSYERRVHQQKVFLEKAKEICRKENLMFDENIEVISGNKSEAFNLIYNSLIQYPQNINKYSFISDNAFFYRSYFSKRDSFFFVDETNGLPSLETVTEVIHKAGGLAFLAHPCAYRLSRPDTLSFIDYAQKCGIDGLEVQHSSNQNDDAAFLYEITKKHNLFISGGSDFHGDTKPMIKICTGIDNVKVQYDEIKDWIKRFV